MKIIPFLLCILTIWSCKKPIDQPTPCANNTIDRTQLDLAWSSSGMTSQEHFASFPIAWKDKVLMVTGNSSLSINCYDGSIGTLIWKVPIEGLISENKLKLSGDKLYWTNDRALWSLDLNTTTVTKVCEFGQGQLSHDFAIWNDLAFCSLYICSAPCDTVTGVGYRVNIQTGSYQEVYRKVQQRAAQDLFVLLDPVIATNPEGDTLFCFMESDRLLPSSDFSTRLVCRNLTSGTSTFSASSHNLWEYSSKGNLNVHQGKAYVPIGDTIYCFSTQNGATLWKYPMKQASLTIKEGYLIAAPDGYNIVNMDLDDGRPIWESGFIGYNIAPFQSAFVQNNHFYFIGEYALCTVDLSTGCLLRQRYAPKGLTDNVNLENGLALSSDGKLIYLRHYPDLIAATFSD